LSWEGFFCSCTKFSTNNAPLNSMHAKEKVHSCSNMWTNISSPPNACNISDYLISIYRGGNDNNRQKGSPVSPLHLLGQEVMTSICIMKPIRIHTARTHACTGCVMGKWTFQHVSRNWNREESTIINHVSSSSAAAIVEMAAMGVNGCCLEMQSHDPIKT
jgi:hypothetical protein